MSFAKYSTNIKLFLIALLTIASLKNTYLKAQDAILNNSDIPIIYLTGFECDLTTFGECSRIDEDNKKNVVIKVIENENGINSIDDNPTLETFIGIEYRGEPSNTKRSFALETRKFNEADNKYDELNVSLLGLPSENDWIFYGPYLDKSLIRNALIYDLVNEMGWYAPKTKFFNFVIDTVSFNFNVNPPAVDLLPAYEGVYVLTERIKRDDDRVDIANLGPSELQFPNPINNQDKTGGYIVSVNDEGIANGVDGWTSSKGNWNYIFEYPQVKLGTGDGLQNIQIEYIKGVFDDFENTMQSANYNDPLTGYSAHINIASFIDFIIVQEFTKNVDGYRKSSYFYKDKNSSGDSLIYAGPVWDFNIAMGNTFDFEGKETTGFQYNFNSNFNDPFQVPNYWPKLMTDPNFITKLKCRYTQLRGTVLSDKNVFGKIDSFENVLKQAADFNFERYPTLLNTAIPANALNGFATYQEAVQQLKDWLTNRFTYLDEQWQGDFFDVKSSASAAICPGEEVTLSVEAEGNVTGLYDWAIGDSIIASQIGASFVIENADPKIVYTVTGFNQNCSDTALVKVNVPGFAAASGGGNKSICPGEIDTLEARGAVKYEWSPAYGFVNENDVFLQRPLVSPAIDTVYQIILTTADNCEIIDSVKVNVKKAPPLTVNEDITTCIGTGVQLTATADSLSSFNWVANPLDANLDSLNSKTANPFVQPNETTAYTVTATGDNNCNSSAIINIEILDVEDTTINFGSYNACNGERLQIDCPNINATSVLWQPSTGLSDPNILCPEIIAQQNIEYTLRAEISDGCIFTGTLQVNLSQGNAINAGSDKTICEGEIVQLNAVGGSGNFIWEGSDAFSDTEISNPTIVLLETTTLKVSSTGACNSEDEITITVIPNPLIVAERELVKCKDEEGVQLEATGAESYNWNPSSGLSDNSIGNPIANPNETTTYTVFTILNGCIFEDSVTVIINTNENYSIGETLTLCNGDSGTLFAAGGLSYNWQPASALQNATSANPTVNTALLSGDTAFEVTIIDANGCSSVLTQMVNIKSNTNIIVIDEVAICSGGQTDLSASGGISYLWEEVSGDLNSIIANGNSANPTVSPTTDTEYKVTITDTDGCSFEGTSTVKIADNIVANIGEDREICSGETVSLNASGGTNYVWTNTSTLETFNGQELTINPNQTTTYAVLVSDGSCEGTDEVTIRVNPLPQPTITGPSAVCEGQNADLSVNEHQTYNWSSSNNTNLPNTDKISVNPATTTIYTVEVSDENGCTALANFELSVNQAPIITISEVEPICANTSTQLSAIINDSSANLSWSTELQVAFSSLVNPVVSPSSTTQYILEAESNGCSSSSSIIVLVNPLPLISITQNPIGDCNSNQIQLNATEGLNYNWQPATGLSDATIANPIASITELTTYTVNASDENGCTNANNVTVKPGLGLDVSISEGVSICRKESVVLTASGGDKYEWFPTGSLSNATASNPTATPQSTTEYTVKITDSNTNCSVNEKVIVTVLSLPVAEAGAASQSFCEGENIQLQLQASQGSSILWSPETGLSNNTIANPVVNIDEDEQYTVTVTDNNGCTASDEVNIFIKPKPTAFAGNDTTLCTAKEIDLNAVTNDSNVEFLWQSTAEIADANDQNTTANITSNTTIILMVSSENNCTATDTLHINIGNNVEAIVIDEITVCEGGSASLSASGGVSYIWSPTTYLNNPTISNPIVTPEGADDLTYTVTVFNEKGCSDTKKVTVSVAADAAPNAGQDLQICTGENVQLFAAGGTTYEWTTSTGAMPNIISNPNIYNPIVSPAITTTFILTVDKGTSCEGTDEVVVKVVNELEVTITPGDIEIFSGQNINLSASGANNYEWITEDESISCTNCENPNISPTANTSYILKGTSGNCVGYDTIMVTLKTCNFETNITEDIIICGGTNSAQLDFSSDSNYNYQWLSNNLSSLSCTNCPNPIATPNVTTTYNVKISDAYCEITETVTVTVLDGAIIFPQSEVQLCRNKTFAFSIADLSNYTIQPQNGFTIANDSIVINPTINRSYTLTGQLSDGCSFVEQLKITVKESPQINLGEDQFLCAGKSVVLNENFNAENASFTWLPTKGLNNPALFSPTAQPKETTSYTIQLEKDGCTATDEITINVIPNNFVRVSKPNTICNGGRAQLSALGGVNYTWSPVNTLSNAFNAAPIAFPASTTTYEVIVEDENGCIEKASVKVNVANKLQVKLNEAFTICKDGNGAQLNATGAFTYSWEPSIGLSSDKIANPIANPATTTTYTLTASDGACTATETTTVNVINQSLTANAGENITICKGDTVQLFASGGLGYVWSNPESLSDHTIANPLAAPTSTTTYNVTTVNIYGCTDFDEITVFVEEGNNDLTISSAKRICQGQEVKLSITFKLGFEYNWLPAGNLNDPKIFDPIATPNTSTIYKVEVTNLRGCKTTYSVAVDVISLAAVSAGDDIIICKDETIQLDATGSDNYLWNEISTLSDVTISNPIANPQNSTNYIVQLQSKGCSKTDTVFVEVVDLAPFAETEQLTVCEGSDITLKAEGGDFYNWNSTDYNFTQPNLQYQTLKPTLATSNYQVEISKANCVAQKQIEILLGPSATYNLTPIFEVCKNGTVQLNLEGENLSNINWLPVNGLNNANIQQPQAVITDNINYAATFTVDGVCLAQANTSVKIIDALNISTNAQSFTICEGAIQTLTANSTTNAAINYEWTLDGNYFASGNEVVVKPIVTTTYAVTGILNQCSDRKEVTVNVVSFNDEVGSVDDFEVCFGDNAQLSAIGGENYIWEPAELLSDALTANPVALNINQPTQFFVTIKTFGCTFKDTLVVSPKECLVEFIPNTFSPNNDGVNDTWFIPEITRFNANELHIYNRWGQLVFNTTNYQNDWKGTYKNAPLPEATYYYLLKIKEESETISGTVTIIR